MESGNDQKSVSGSKRAYRTPMLVDYGLVAHLTLGSGPKKTVDGGANKIVMPTSAVFRTTGIVAPDAPNG